MKLRVIWRVREYPLIVGANCLAEQGERSGGYGVEGVGGAAGAGGRRMTGLAATEQHFHSMYTLKC